LAENTLEGCPFCDPALQARAVRTWGSVLAVPDIAPVADGHLLVITRRHAEDIFQMTPREYRDAMRLLAALRERALQKIMHAHIHFIPRREGDGPEGRGVKGVIRNRFSY